MLPPPNLSPRQDKDFLSSLTGRGSRSLRLLVAVLLAIFGLAWLYQSASDRAVVTRLRPSSYVFEPDEPTEAPPLSGGDRISPTSEGVKALLDFVVTFPNRDLPDEIVDHPNIFLLLDREANAAGRPDWENPASEVPVVVFSKTYCPYSRRAKELLASMHLSPPPVIVEADLRHDASVLKRILTRLTHHSTFPNVFIGGQSVGGSDDLRELYEDGTLGKLLRNAGVEFQSTVEED